MNLFKAALLLVPILFLFGVAHAVQVGGLIDADTGTLVRIWDGATDGNTSWSIAGGYGQVTGGEIIINYDAGRGYDYDYKLYNGTNTNNISITAIAKFDSSDNILDLIGVTNSARERGCLMRCGGSGCVVRIGNSTKAEVSAAFNVEVAVSLNWTLERTQNATATKCVLYRNGVVNVTMENVAPDAGSYNIYYRGFSNSAGSQGRVSELWTYLESGLTTTISLPANDTYDSNNVELEYTADSDAPINYDCTVTIDDDVNTTYVVEDEVAESMTMTGLVQGDHNVTVNCFDGVTNASDTEWFEVDTVIEMTIISPSNTTYTGSAMNVTYLPNTTAMVDEVSCTVYFDGDANDTYTDSNNTERTFDFTQLIDGAHNVTVNCGDGTDNITRTVVYTTSFVLELGITSPSNSTYMDSDLILTYKANTTYPSVVTINCTVSFDDDVNTTYNTANNTAKSLGFRELNATFHNVSVNCYDGAKNLTRTAYYTMDDLNFTLTDGQNATAFEGVTNFYNVTIGINPDIVSDINASLYWNDTQVGYEYKSQKIGGRCLQEYANEITTCGGVGSGTYSFSNAFNDGNWGSSIGTSGNYDINYTKPFGALTDSKLLYSYSTQVVAPEQPEVFNNESLSIPINCWNHNYQNLSFRVNAALIATGVNLTCQSGVNEWTQLHTFGGGAGSTRRVVEEEMNWSIIPTYNFNETFMLPIITTNNTSINTKWNATKLYINGSSYEENSSNSAQSCWHAWDWDATTYSVNLIERSFNDISVNVSKLGGVGDPVNTTITAALVWNGSPSTMTATMNTSTKLGYSNTTRVPKIAIGYNWSFGFNVTLNYSMDHGIIGYRSRIDTNTTYNYTQTVHKLMFTDCTTGLEALKLRFFDEISPDTPVNSSVDAYLEIFLDDGTNSSFGFEFTNNETFRICIEPYFSSFRTNSEFTYGGASIDANYTYREYYLVNASINNVSNNIDLHTLATANGTALTFTVTDEFGTEIEGVVVKALRWYPLLTGYKTINMGKTNFDGDAVLNLKFYDTYYKFLFEQNGTVVKEISKLIIYSTPLAVSIAEVLDTYYTILDNVEYTIHDLSNVSDVITWGITVSDTSGLMSSVNLKCVKKSLLGDTVINDTTITGSAVTVYCVLGNYSNNVFYITATGTFNDYGILIIYSDTFDWREPYAYGVTGLFAAFMIIGSLMFIGLWNPGASIILGIIGLILTNALGLLDLAISNVMGLIIVGVLVILMRRRNS